MVKVTWLGTSSGAPTSRRNVSSIAVRYGNDRIFLVDCGEGTRNQMRLAGINPALVTHIFITHLHGDHCFGIPGTIAAISAARAGTSFENEPIEVYGPPELHRLLLAAYRAAQQAITTPVVLRTWVLDPARAAPLATAPVGDGKLVMGFQAPDQASKLPPRLAQQWQADYDAGSDDVVQPGLTWTTTLPGGIVVRAAQLQHRMPCWGYVFQEPALPATAEDVREARAKGAGSGSGASSSDEGESGGEDWGDDGVGGEFVHPGRKLVILGDTCDSRAIAPIAYGCDLLSHEATYSKGESLTFGMVLAVF